MHQISLPGAHMCWLFIGIECVAHEQDVTGLLQRLNKLSVGQRVVIRRCVLVPLRVVAADGMRHGDSQAHGCLLDACTDLPEEYVFGHDAGSVGAGLRCLSGLRVRVGNDKDVEGLGDILLDRETSAFGDVL